MQRGLCSPPLNQPGQHSTTTGAVPSHTPRQLQEASQSIPPVHQHLPKASEDMRVPPTAANEHHQDPATPSHLGAPSSTRLEEEDDPSFVQHSLFSAPLTQHNSQSSLADAMLDDTPQQQPDTSPAVPAATAVDELTQATMAVQQTYPPTTPGDMSMPSTGPMHQETTAAEQDQLEEYNQQIPQGDDARERSWQRVERHLLEIRRLAANRGHNMNNTAGIVSNAEQALVHLLVDTPTAAALDTPDGGSVAGHSRNDHPNTLTAQPGSSSRGTRPTATTIRQQAEAAAAALANIARQQLASDGGCISYGMLEPHVAALMDWMSMLPTEDVAVRIQLPPVVTPLRGILERILLGATSTDDWASLVAMAALCTGNQLTHPADVVAINTGGIESTLVERVRGSEDWEMAIVTLQQLLGEVSNWPTARLPRVQEAAMQLVRGISRQIPEESRGMPDTEEHWWMSERHHGMGNLAVYRGSTSPRERHPRRQRSSSSGDDSHRRRRLHAMHFAEHP